jgi:fatty-acyl-CoA synthase
VSPVETTIGESLRVAASRHPEDPGLIFFGGQPGSRRQLSYAELLAQAERAAHALLARFEPGERVALWAPSTPEWVIFEFAAALAGLTLVTVNPSLGADMLGPMLQRASAHGLFWGEQPGAAEAAGKVRAALPLLRESHPLRDLERLCASVTGTGRLPEVLPGDPAQIQHTSGTTGVPKPVLLTHGSLMARARIGAVLAGLSRTDRMINPMPMFHTSGCNWMALGSTLSGAAHVLLPRFEPRLILEAIHAERGTTLVGFATMLQAITERPDLASYDLSSLRYIVAGGSSVPTALVRRIEERLGAGLSVLYGMTECSGVVTQTLPEDGAGRVGVTVGRPFPETDLKIIDPATGQVLPVGELGELCVRGGLVMAGYVGEPPVLDADGWFHTGDFGSLDAQGYCSVEGRRYDLIVRGGRYVSPRPLEECLAKHPSVAEVVIVAAPGSNGGHFVATVRPTPGTRPAIEELEAWLSSSLPGVQDVPARWVLVDQLPLTGTGKVHRYKVHEQLVA